jgi:hypothetical protein
MSTKESKAESKNSAARMKILKTYVKIIKTKNMFPTRSNMKDEGISRDQIRNHFVNLANLRSEAKLEFPQYFEGVISEKKYSSKEYQNFVDNKIKKHRRLVITTPVNGQKVHEGFISSLKQYCKSKDALLLLTPAYDPINNLFYEGSIEWHFDSSLKDELYLFNQTSLNSNVFVSSLRVNAKQINPTTGLGRICQGKGSFIFASPKQSLEFDPVSNVKYPHARMTTGACTIPNYSYTKGNSQRMSFIAEHDHVIGAVIVEIQDDKIYHFRQIQADEKGGFCDLGLYYLGNKEPKKMIPSLVMGDSHFGEHDETATNAWNEMIDLFKIKRVFVHDLFNGQSINHHEEDNIILRSKHAKYNRLSLKQELEVTGHELDKIGNRKSVNEIVIVASNHNDFLGRWLENGKFKYDPINFELGCKLSLEMLSDKDPIQEGLREFGGIENWDKLKFLHRDVDYKICGIECGAHGDKGPNGSRGNKINLERAYGKAVIGHSHTPGILRGIFQVGTSSLLRLVYNVGPSSWMHCSCLVYENGQRQLINSINGSWHLQD